MDIRILDLIATVIEHCEGRVEPLAWVGVAFRLRQGVLSRRNRRRVASTRTVSAGGCPGPGSPGPWQRSITVAIRSKILGSNSVPF